MTPFLFRARRARGLQAALGLVALAAALLGAPAGVLAERADRDKPIVIDADRLQYDDLKQTSVFTGNVVLTKGTIVVRADRLVLRQDADGFQHASAVGRPVTFRQRRDAPDQRVEGESLELEYDGRRETVTLRERAQLRRLERERMLDEVQGAVIVYESLTEFFTVEGGQRAPTASNPGGRVKVIIQPRGNETTPAPPATLRPADRLGAPAAERR